MSLESAREEFKELLNRPTWPDEPEFCRRALKLYNQYIQRTGKRPSHLLITAEMMGELDAYMDGMDKANRAWGLMRLPKPLPGHPMIRTYYGMKIQVGNCLDGFCKEEKP
jgi:hypothetical protein